MKKLTLLFALLLMVSTVAMAQKRGKKRTRRTETTAVTINYTARGELGIFDLRGPVKTCVWKKAYETHTYAFDPNGMWISTDGEQPWNNYGSVKRDAQGRIILMGEEVESGESFTYNANGLVTKHTVIYMDGRDVTTYSYNSEGYCTKETFSYSGMDGTGKNSATWTILTRDEQGNWTKRKTQKGVIETRTITYF